MNSQKFTNDPESVRLSRIGELKIDGKPALNLASDMRSASRQVYFLGNVDNGRISDLLKFLVPKVGESFVFGS